MFPQTQSKTLNRATILMLCITSLLLVFTTLNHLGDAPSTVMLKLSFVAVGCTALLLYFITPVSGVTLPDQVDLMFLYNESQLRKMRRLKYICMVTILLVQCSLLVVLTVFPSMVLAMAVCLFILMYTCGWLASHDIRLVSYVENYIEW